MQIGTSEEEGSTSIYTRYRRNHLSTYISRKFQRIDRSFNIQIVYRYSFCGSTRECHDSRNPWHRRRRSPIQYGIYGHPCFMNRFQKVTPLPSQSSDGKDSDQRFGKNEKEGRFCRLPLVHLSYVMSMGTPNLSYIRTWNRVPLFLLAFIGTRRNPSIKDSVFVFSDISLLGLISTKCHTWYNWFTD